MMSNEERQSTLESLLGRVQNNRVRLMASRGTAHESTPELAAEPVSTEPETYTLTTIIPVGEEHIEAQDEILVDDSVAVEDEILVDDSVAVEDEITVDDSVAVEDEITVDDSVAVEDEITVDDSVAVEDEITVDDDVAVEDEMLDTAAEEPPTTPLPMPSEPPPLSSSAPPLSSSAPPLSSSAPPVALRTAQSEEVRTFDPSIEASSSIAEFRGDLPREWSLKAVLERAWTLGSD